MAHVNKATLLGTNPTHAGDSPGGGTNSKFMSVNEPAAAQYFNRALVALADNSDEHETEITRKICTPVVGVLTLASPASSFTVGSGGDIDITGGTPAYSDLYMGRSSWSDTQENRDHLFEILDSDYNEVVVGGDEAKAASFTGAAVGDGFVDVTGGTVTVTLNVTLPAGSYRIGMFCDSTMATMEEDWCVTTSVRGLHEAPSESGFKGAYILDAAGSAPCDFSGATALQDALNTLGDDCTLYLRPGTYNLAVVGGGAELVISQNNVTIIGASSDKTNGVDLVVDSASSHDLEITGNYVELRNVSIRAAAAGRSIRCLSAEFTKLSSCYVENLYVYTDGSADYGVIENSDFDSDDGRIMWLVGAHWVISNCRCTVGGTTSTDEVIRVGGDECVFNAVRVNKDLSDSLQDALRVSGGSQVFNNCYFYGAAARALVYDSTGDPLRTVFNGCTFRNRPVDTAGNNHGPIMPTTAGVAQNVQLTFTSCHVEATFAGYYNGPFVQLLAQDPDTSDTTLDIDVLAYIRLDNVTFVDRGCKGSDTAVDPDGNDTGTTPFPVAEFHNVIGTGVVFDRHGMGYDIQDSSWLEISGDSDITNLRIPYETDFGPHTIDTGVTEPALLRVLDGSVVRNLKFVGFMGLNSSATDTWNRQLLEIAGSSVSASRGKPKALVDGMQIAQLDDVSSPHEWFFASSMELVTVTYGDIRRFIWTFGNRLNDTTSLRSLIRLDDYSTARDCEIEICGPTYDEGGLLQFAIEVIGEQCSIEGNRVHAQDPANSEVNMTTLVYGAGTQLRVKNNVFETYDSDPTNADGSFITMTSNRLIVEGNYFYGDEDTTPDSYISAPTAVYIATGNIFDNKGTGGAPSADWMVPNPTNNANNLFT